MSGLDEMILGALLEMCFYENEVEFNTPGTLEWEQAMIMYRKYEGQYNGLLKLQEEWSIDHGNSTNQSNQEPS